MRQDKCNLVSQICSKALPAVFALLILLQLAINQAQSQTCANAVLDPATNAIVVSGTPDGKSVLLSFGLSGLKKMTQFSITESNNMTSSETIELGDNQYFEGQIVQAIWDPEQQSFVKVSVYDPITGGFYQKALTVPIVRLARTRARTATELFDQIFVRFEESGQQNIPTLQIDILYDALGNFLGAVQDCISDYPHGYGYILNLESSMNVDLVGVSSSPLHIHAICKGSGNIVANGNYTCAKPPTPGVPNNPDPTEAANQVRAGIVLAIAQLNKAKAAKRYTTARKEAQSARATLQTLFVPATAAIPILGANAAQAILAAEPELKRGLSRLGNLQSLKKSVRKALSLLKAGA